MTLQPLHYILCELELCPQPQRHYWPWDVAALVNLGLVVAYDTPGGKPMVALLKDYRIANPKKTPVRGMDDAAERLVSFSAYNRGSRYREGVRRRKRARLMAQV